MRGSLVMPDEEAIMNKDEARRLTDEIRSTAGRLDELLRRAYTERAWKALDYPDWSSYIDGEFADMNRQWRYTWRAFGEVADAGVRGPDGEPLGSDQARRLRPRLHAVGDDDAEHDDLSSLMGAGSLDDAPRHDRPLPRRSYRDAFERFQRATDRLINADPRAVAQWYAEHGADPRALELHLADLDGAMADVRDWAEDVRRAVKRIRNRADKRAA
jgi:hypothetical protein